jgi:predicted RNA-binding protein with PIN domain
LDGILTGAVLTDVEIEITGGKSHNKHTNGGDFAKATKIAVRDALMRAESALLEPYYDVMIKVPLEKCGRAMTDIEKMKGKVLSQSTDGEFTTIEGKIPVNEFSDYDAEVRSYSGGLGQISVEPGGYDICHNADEIIDRVGYDYKTDVNNPYESIYVHGRDDEEEMIPRKPEYREEKEARYDENEYRGMHAFDPELEKIFVRTYGEIKRYKETVVYRPEEKGEVEKEYKPKNTVDHKRYVFIDGYNIVNGWSELSEIAKKSLDGARGRLEDIVSDYQGYTGYEVFIVYDAYRLKGYSGSKERRNNIHICFTREDEKADQYIEREVTSLCRKGKNVTVVTSDGWVQKISLGAGALRMSAREFEIEIDRIKKQALEEFENRK